jgi:TonB family protein
MRISPVIPAFSLMLAIPPAAKAQDRPEQLPKVLQHAEPAYPPLARQTLIQGDVRVKLTTDGVSVTNAEVTEGHPLLGKAAEDNVRTWKFAPHHPGTFYVTFRYKIASGGLDVEFLEASSLVEVEVSPTQMSIYYASLDLGRWKSQLASDHGKSRRIFDLSSTGPDGEWLNGKVLGEKGEDEEIDFGRVEGDFVAFTVKLRQPDGKQPMTFFVGNLKGNRIVGTFVDDSGVTGKWTATRLPDDSKSPNAP